MANQQLVDYIKSQLAAGVTKPDLLKAIETAGWSAQDTTDAFNVVEGKAPMTPAAPATPKPAAPAQAAAPAQPVQQPVTPVTPAQPIVNPSGPTSTIAPNLGGPMRASTMQMNVRREGPASRMWLWVTLTVGAFVLAIAAAAFIFMPQIQEILSFYLGGAQAPVVTEPVGQNPVIPTVPDMATTTATTTSTMGTTTATTTPKTGAVASTTASTTLGH